MLTEIIPAFYIGNEAQPANIAISLSHRDGTALCAVVPAGTSAGCDLETIEPRSEAFVVDYFTASEKDLLARTPIEHYPLAVALVWSAKESALKALQQGLRLDTRCVSARLVDGLLHLGRNEQQESPVSNPDGWRSLTVHCSDGPVYGGWWRFQDDLVRTVVSDFPLQIPARAR